MGEYCGSHRNTHIHLPSLWEANVQRKTQHSHVSKAAGTLFETAHSAASAFDGIYSVGQKRSSQANTRAGLHSPPM